MEINKSLCGTDLRPRTLDREERAKKDVLVDEIEKMFKEADVSYQLAEEVLKKVAERQNQLGNICIQKTKYRCIFPAEN
ncbi:MAG: hypothetical protein J6D08_02000 [Lachnospiraceae bacterium]|nr:hypothetical protein [Lachnospiraceae bacterium]